jgi:hypothetical protein
MNQGSSMSSAVQDLAAVAARFRAAMETDDAGQRACRLIDVMSTAGLHDILVRLPDTPAKERFWTAICRESAHGQALWDQVEAENRDNPKPDRIRVSADWIESVQREAQLVCRFADERLVAGV